MKPNRQAKRYAEALLNVSTELNCIEQTGKSLLLIDKLITHENVFRAFFYTKRIEPTKKAEILKNVLGDLINPVVHEFFALLAERNEYGMFLSVASAFGKLQRESLNIIDVTTFSIDEIDESLIKSIITGIEESTGKRVELESQIDDALLGGLKLRVGNTIFDGTIANQMAKMKKVLLQNN